MAKKKQGRSDSGQQAVFVSMTGFGRAQAERHGVFLEVEVRTINSRYLDLNFRTPRNYSVFEPKLRQLLSGFFERGRVDINVQRRITAVDETDIVFNQSLFEALKGKYNLALGPGLAAQSEVQAQAALQILSRKEVLDPVTESVDQEQELELLLELASQAASAAQSQRRQEGARLALDFCSRVENLMRIREQLAIELKDAHILMAERIKTRVSKLLTEVSLDPGRLEQEIAFLADKTDVAEELVRLDSHFIQLHNLAASAPNGRKLEFLLQEIGREFNTISSKAQHAPAQSLVVDAKAELERIREQLQNIE